MGCQLDDDERLNLNMAVPKQPTIKVPDHMASIVQAHIARIERAIAAPGSPARKAFEDFLGMLRTNLPDLPAVDAVEMIAQQIITRPVFEILFSDHKFIGKNPVSRAIQAVLDAFCEDGHPPEHPDLTKFYASVRQRVEALADPRGQQKLVVDIYNDFFAKAFKKTVEKLGIVYTPIEIVDFMIKSVNEILQAEFGKDLGSEGVQIMDPFTGTGTFITRMLQSGLISPEQMERKYKNEIFANELVPLAYYIASINIEAVYHGLIGGDYVPFEGIALTDTFKAA